MSDRDLLILSRPFSVSVGYEPVTDAPHIQHVGRLHRPVELAAEAARVRVEGPRPAEQAFLLPHRAAVVPSAATAHGETPEIR